MQKMLWVVFLNLFHLWAKFCLLIMELLEIDLFLTIQYLLHQFYVNLQYVCNF